MTGPTERALALVAALRTAAPGTWSQADVIGCCAVAEAASQLRAAWGAYDAALRETSQDIEAPDDTSPVFLTSDELDALYLGIVAAAARFDDALAALGEETAA